MSPPVSVATVAVSQFTPTQAMCLLYFHYTFLDLEMSPPVSVATVAVPLLTPTQIVDRMEARRDNRTQAEPAAR